MGANSTQALGVLTFLLGFTALSGGLFAGKIIFYPLAVLLLAASVMVFRKCKPYEDVEK